MKISTWSKLGFTLVVLLLTGQACSINIGTSSRLDGGIFRSDDHGKTWVQKNFVRVDNKRQINLDDVTGRLLAFDPVKTDRIYLGTLANGIWVTSNGGDQWQPTSLRSGAYECLSFDNLNPDIMYTVAGTVVLKSIDAGATWSTVYTETQPGQAVNSVIANPNDGRQIWATTSGGKVVMSTDYGQRWTVKGALPAMQPRRMYITANNTFYIFTRTSGIYRSDDRGETWVAMNTALAAFPGSTDIRAMVIHRDGWFLATAGGLLKSTDSGANWKMISTLVAAGSVVVQTVAVNPKNSLDIFITTDQRLHHTVNGGESWSVTTLPTGRLPVLMTFDPTNIERMYFATYKQPKK